MTAAPPSLPPSPPPLPALSLYVGETRHRRFRPVRNEFRRALLMMMLDLDQGDIVRQRFPVLNALRLLTYRPRDGFPDSPDGPKNAVLRAVEAECGVRPRGPVHLLAQPRQMGVGYNPARFYFVADGGPRPAWLVTEVHNTPWGERAAYVAPMRGAGRSRAALAKRMHVSPFNPMGMLYRWRFIAPDERFFIRMECARPGESAPDMEAALRLRRIPESQWSRALLGGPCVAALSAARIYWSAAALALRGAKFHPHPKSTR